MGAVNDRSSQTPLVTFYADDNAVWGGCRYDGDGAFYSGRGGMEAWYESGPMHWSRVRVQMDRGEEERQDMRERLLKERERGRGLQNVRKNR